MANCSDQFKALNDAVSLTKTERKLLRLARRTVTQKITQYFNEHDTCPKVRFLGQGSFSMDTIVRPLSGDFDIDVGVYLLGYSNYTDDWPKPETISVWIAKALDGHTSYSPINKRTCIRIKYKPIFPNSDVAYHVDLPVYCTYKNFLGAEYTRIGITGTIQWSQKSNPTGFTNWFVEKCQLNEKDKNQLVRIVKYMKVWKENVQGDSKFPSGMALTVLLANNFVPNTRDDLSFRETIKKAYNELYPPIAFSYAEILSPVTPYSNLISRLTDNHKAYFKYRFEELVDDGKIAIEDPFKHMSIARWKIHFGPRFPENCF